MISENKTKAKLKRGERVFGVISNSADTMLAELIGLAGFDYYMLDAEHGGVSPSDATNFVRACELTGLTPLVRVGQRDAKLVLQYMDAGMLGVMMPGLETADNVGALVAAVKYPPLGKRGLGMVRAADYMLNDFRQADYVTFANEQTLVWPQFEDVKLLPVLSELAAVRGVDGVVIGPRDLSMAMGHYDGPENAEVQHVIDEVIATLNRAGVPTGITAATGEAAQKQLQRGARIILNAVPSLIQHSAHAFLEGAKV
ncbi:MAG: HpcH/HpaI aldolase family protein [Anaerolineales bacterium]